MKRMGKRVARKFFVRWLLGARFRSKSFPKLPKALEYAEKKKGPVFILQETVFENGSSRLLLWSRLVQ